MTQKKKTTKQGVGSMIGAALTGAVVATAAGIVYLYGKNGEKHRKQVQSWMLKARGEVMDKLEKMKTVSEREYKMTVDAVVAKYAKLKTVHNTDVAALKKDLLAHWKEIVKETKQATADTKKRVASAAKRVKGKKVSKK